MKINILLADTVGKHSNFAIIHTKIDSYEEARRLNPSSIERDTYFMIKALEKNSDFVKEVKKIRQENKIPINGFSYKEWNKIKRDKNTPFHSMWQLNLEKSCTDRLPKIVNVPDILINSLMDIVKLNTVFLPLPKIFVQKPYVLFPTLSHNSVKIVINAYLSRTKLKSIIDEIYDTEIKEAMLLMKGKKTKSIHGFAERLTKLRETKHFPEIAKELKKEHGYEEPTLRKIVSDYKKNLKFNSKK